MKKIVYSIILTILVAYILLAPQNAIQAASFGLTLWYTNMLPTLLPFAILSYIFVASGLLLRPCQMLHRGLKHLLPVSAPGVYPLFAGFLFGFPLGSRITAQLVEEGQISRQEGRRLFVTCNNIGPVFISSFLMSTCLRRPDLTVKTLLLLYLPPLLLFAVRGRMHPLQAPSLPPTKKEAPRSQINFKIIDAGIMSGFETLTKLGGYIMLFAILAQMVKSLPLHSPLLSSLLVGITELTNGTASIAAAPLPFGQKYLLAVFCTAFGGLSGIAQTASMVHKANLPMGEYVAAKILCSLASVLLAAVWILPQL